MTRTFLPAAIALFCVAAFANHADASCGSSNRVSSADSDCLVASNTNDTYHAYNYCLHEIKVKVDVKNDQDRTRTIGAAQLQVCTTVHGIDTCFTTSNQGVAHLATIVRSSVEGAIHAGWGVKIRSVTCCSDHSTCDRKSTDTYPPTTSVPNM